MKHLRLLSTVLVLLAVILFGGMSIASASALNTLPDKVKSDAIYEVEYIKNFPVIVKKTDGGKYYVYCMNMSATYGANITFTKTGTADPGFTYILNNRPKTSDPDRDFYITQMAVWYYDDYVNKNNFNLIKEVKTYLMAHSEEPGVAKEIYDLYYGAKMYSVNKEAEKDHVSINNTKEVVFKVDGDYYVSSEIFITADEVDNLKYGLENAPKGSKIVKSENGVKVKVPVGTIPVGHKLSIKLTIEGTYKKYEAYYYFYNTSYQKVLFQDPVVLEEVDKDEITMTIYNSDKYKVNISKTDITQSNEIAGATLTVKDAAGALVDQWVSTTEAHKIELAPGEYSLNEVIAPTGYKLSSTTIWFKVDAAGSLFAKNEKGEYVSVGKINMINELIDVVSFAKKDSATDAYLAGAKLVIKDAKGNVVHEFVSTDSVYQYTLQSGYYTLSEVSAPNGYVLSDEVVYFYLAEDGTLQVKNNKGNYTDTAMIVFYNTKKKSNDVIVPSTGLSSTLMIVSGLALTAGGLYFVKKTIKEC